MKKKLNRERKEEMSMPGSSECFRACERYMIDYPLLGGFLLCPKWNLKNY